MYKTVIAFPRHSPAFASHALCLPAGSEPLRAFPRSRGDADAAAADAPMLASSSLVVLVVGIVGYLH